jgi:hypothetical protein
MKRLTLFIALLIAGTSCAQDNYVDSCENVLGSDIHDTARARIYIDLAEYIGDESEWMRYNKLALDLANDKLMESKGKTL